MKKFLTITVLMALAMSGFAQNQYDFSAVCESGQTLYYRITDAEAHTVILTHPYRQEGNPWFEGDYYEGYVKPEGEIIISSVVTYNGTDYTVTAIDSNSFGDCIITSIFIPNTVNHITPRAFGSCTSLESISVDETNPIFYSENNTIIRREDNALVVGCKTSTIPEGIEIICQQAIYAMDYSGVLTIPNSVRIIENGAFAYNLFSGSLALPESLETLGSMAFYASGFSGSLTMPNSVTEIGHHAFYGCRFSGSLTLSSSLSTIENCAFADCQFSGTLVIPNSVNLIVGAAFSGNNFSELVLGESVATIESIAFLDCNNLTGALRLPASLTQIDQLAFKNTSFNEIYSPNRMPPTLNTTDLYPFAFDGYDTSTPIHIPFGCTEAYQNAEGWNYFSNFIEAPAPIVPDLYTIGYKDNSSTTRTAMLYKNHALLHSINISGKQVTPYKIAGDSEGNIYWLVVYSENSSTRQTEIWKNGELYLSNEGLSGYRITDLFCIGDTLFYVGNTTLNKGIRVATVWTGPEFTPHWVLGDGIHDSFIYEAAVDKSTNIPYFCGFVTDSLTRATVWKASQTLYTSYTDCYGNIASSEAKNISMENGVVYTQGYNAVYYDGETYYEPVIWKDGEIQIEFADDEIVGEICAFEGDYYYVYQYPHGFEYSIMKNRYTEVMRLVFNQSGVQSIRDGFDDIYAVGRWENKAAIWKNFELLSQRDDCDVIMDILAVEATEVDTTFSIDNTEWYYEILNDDGSITYQHLVCTGDTIVQGKRPKVIVRSNTHYDRDENTEVTHEYIYEENGIVYWWNKDLQEFTTLYNLNANAGDEWEIIVGNESLTMHVDAVENYDYEGQTYRMLHVSDSANVFSGNIVCSIGHLTSFFPERLMTRGKGYRVEGMRCYWVNGELVFKYGDKDCDEVYEQLHHGIDEPGENGPSTGSGALTVYPNPTDGVLFVETNGHASLSNQTYRITNLMGQTLLQGPITDEIQKINIESLPAGMYFITFAGETLKFVIE